MRRVKVTTLIAAGLMILPGMILAQGTGGSGTFGGTVPTTFSITDTTNNSLSATMAAFSNLTVGKGSLVTPTALSFRLRSNANYQLTAQVGSLSGIAAAATAGPSNTAQGITTGDIGFGFTTAIDKSGASVVNGGASPTRTDTIGTGFDATGGWPSVTNGHTPSFTKTLHDIDSSAVEILNGDRISASGDNSSNDNYLTVTLGMATLPQYLTPGPFSGTVTLTIAAQ